MIKYPNPNKKPILKALNFPLEQFDKKKYIKKENLESLKKKDCRELG